MICSRTIRSLFALMFVASCPSLVAAAEVVVDFEELSLPGPASFYNGDPGGLQPGYDGSFSSQGVSFSNTFNRQDFGSGPVVFWNGWAYSNVTDNTTSGVGNQYSAFAGSGAGGSNYGISSLEFGNAVAIPADYTIKSIDITNTTYAAISMRDGDSFAKVFGGTTGDDPDFFKLIISGYSGGEGGTPVGTVEFFLADFQFADNSQDYIVEDWTTVDLTSLAAADTLTFSYESTDVHPTFGINTPQYFAADNLVFETLAVPEPSSWLAMLICASALLIAWKWASVLN